MTLSIKPNNQKNFKKYRTKRQKIKFYQKIKFMILRLKVNILLFIRVPIKVQMPNKK